MSEESDWYEWSIEEREQPARDAELLAIIPSDALIFCCPENITWNPVKGSHTDVEYPADFCQRCFAGLREHLTHDSGDVYILYGSAMPLAKIDALCQDIANGEDVCVYRPPPKACRQT